jgi:hypothetical protein
MLLFGTTLKSIMPKQFLIPAVLIVIVVLVAGCTQSNEPFVGSYKGNAMTGATTLTLNGDGSYTQTFANPPTITSGKWHKVDATTIKLTGTTQVNGRSQPDTSTITYDQTNDVINTPGGLQYSRAGK